MYARSLFQHKHELSYFSVICIDVQKRWLEKNSEDDDDDDDIDDNDGCVHGMKQLLSQSS